MAQPTELESKIIDKQGNFQLADRQAAVAADVVILTDSTGGTANDTLENLADGSTWANDHAATENNFADLAAKVNELIVQQNLILDILEEHGLVADN